MMTLSLSRKGGYGTFSPCTPFPHRELSRTRTYQKVGQWTASYCTTSISNSVNRSLTRFIPCSSSHHYSFCQSHIPSIRHFEIQLSKPFIQYTTQPITPFNPWIFPFSLITFERICSHTTVRLLTQIRLYVETSNNKSYKPEHTKRI
jgi:hypothetical protein